MAKQNIITKARVNGFLNQAANHGFKFNRASKKMIKLENIQIDLTQELFFQ